MKSIFLYTVTKEFLREFINQLPRKGWGEVQRWADHLGVQPSFISQILSGKKSLNVDQAIQLATMLGLTGLELDYFILMVEKEKSGYQAQIYFEEKLKRIRSDANSLVKRVPRDKVFTEEQKSIFYSTWLYSAIRMLCSLPNGQTVDELSKHLNIKKDEMNRMMKFLTDTNLCVKKGSSYVVGARKTHLEKDSPHVRKHWTNWHIKAVQKFDQVKTDEIVYSAPFTISHEDFEKLRQELTKFIADFVQRVGQTQSEKVAFLNIDLMNLF